MNIFRLTHMYSPANMSKVISSDIAEHDLWNIIYLFQSTMSEIDSTHLAVEANIETLLIKYFDAASYDPNFYYDETKVIDIDLHLNWEIGFIDSKSCRQIYDWGNRYAIVEEHKQKYNFYKQDMYSYILQLILREHCLFEGEIGDEASFGMNNRTWQVLFSEGFYHLEELKHSLSANKYYQRKINE